jgi:Putative prokaryotic signal transducing protein
MSEAEDEGDWVEIRRASTPVEADMVRDFLMDHGVRSAVNGDSGGTRLPWQHTMMDIRIVVSPRDVDEAREVLAAMVSDAIEHPFRGAPPAGPAHELRDDREGAPYEKKRSVMAAMMLAWLVPIGSGHFYARHGAAGTLICAGIVGAFVGILLGHPETAVAAGMLVLVDVLGAYPAVKRHNEGRIPSDAVQRRWAIGAVLLAYAVAMVVARA